MKVFSWLFLLLTVLFIFCKNDKPTSPSIQSLPVNQPINSPEKEVKPIVFDYDTAIWTDIGLIDPTITLDLKYATTDNFVKEKMYDCGRCFLRPEVATLILKAQQQLKTQGLSLKLFDCYRPKPIQEKLWAKVPNANYVTPPWKGSMHNRGAAIDLTIVDKNGVALDMGTAYDFFGKEAHHTFTAHSPKVNANRKLLKDLMESYDLRPIRTEWWHYSYQKKSYDISEMQWACPNQ